LKKLILYFLFAIIPFALIHAQDSLQKKKFPVIETAIHTGYLIKNYPHLPNSTNTFSAEIYAGIQTYGNKEWNSHFRYPQVGISLLYNYFGNDSVFGRNISALPNFTFRHGKADKFHGELRLGLGIAYFTKIYNIRDNPTNLYIGSRLTNVSHASYNIVKFVHPYLAIKTGISVFHFSNGHYQLPNIGMNIPSFNLGLKYFPNKMPVIRNNKIDSFDNKWLFNARLGIGWHEFGYSTYPAGGPKYPVYCGTFYVSKRFTAINKLKLGLFVNYYTSFYDFITTQEIYKNKQGLKSSVASVFIGHEFVSGHFGFVAEAGINIYNPFFNKFIRLYTDKPELSSILKSISNNKLGFQYYPISSLKSGHNKLYIGAYIKANLGQADFLEWSVGYSW